MVLNLAYHSSTCCDSFSKTLSLEREEGHLACENSASYVLNCFYFFTEYGELLRSRARVIDHGNYTSLVAGFYCRVTSTPVRRTGSSAGAVTSTVNSAKPTTAILRVGPRLCRPAAAKVQTPSWRHSCLPQVADDATGIL